MKKWSFPGELLFHRGSFPFPLEMWKKRYTVCIEKGCAFSLVAVIDIGLDLFHRLRKGRVLFHLLFDLLQGVEHGGMVPVIKYLADFHHRQVGHAADQVTWRSGRAANSVLHPLLSADDLFFNAVILADVIQNIVWRGNVLIALFQDILHGPGDGGFIGLVASRSL